MLSVVYRSLQAVKLAAKFISWVFHPLFVLAFSSLVLISANPYLFGSQPDMIAIYIVIYSIFYPVIGILLLRGTGLVSSLEMPEKKQRIIPYLMTSIFYLWFYANIRGNPDFPLEFSVLLLSSIISIFLCFFINIFDKVSAHAAGSVGLLVHVWLILFHFSDGRFQLPTGISEQVDISLVYVLLIAILVVGLVATSRLYLEAHNMRQITGGWLIGLLSPIISIKILDYAF